MLSGWYSLDVYKHDCALSTQCISDSSSNNTVPLTASAGSSSTAHPPLLSALAYLQDGLGQVESLSRGLGAIAAPQDLPGHILAACQGHVPTLHAGCELLPDAAALRRAEPVPCAKTSSQLLQRCWAEWLQVKCHCRAVVVGSAGGSIWMHACLRTCTGPPTPAQPLSAMTLPECTVAAAAAAALQAGST